MTGPTFNFDKLVVRGNVNIQNNIQNNYQGSARKREHDLTLTSSDPIEPPPPPPPPAGTEGSSRRAALQANSSDTEEASEEPHSTHPETQEEVAPNEAASPSSSAAASCEGFLLFSRSDTNSSRLQSARLWPLRPFRQPQIPRLRHFPPLTALTPLRTPRAQVQGEQQPNLQQVLLQEQQQQSARLPPLRLIQGQPIPRLPSFPPLVPLTPLRTPRAQAQQQQQDEQRRHRDQQLLTHLQRQLPEPTNEEVRPPPPPRRLGQQLFPQRQHYGGRRGRRPRQEQKVRANQQQSPPSQDAAESEQQEEAPHMGPRRSTRLEGKSGLPDALKDWVASDTASPLHDDDYVPESSDNEAGPSAARAGPSVARPNKRGKRQRDTKDLTWTLYRDHWHETRTELVNAGLLQAAWGDLSMRLKDLPVTRQGDGDLLWW